MPTGQVDLPFPLLLCSIASFCVLLSMCSWVLVSSKGFTKFWATKFWSVNKHVMIMQLQHKCWLCVFVGSICLVVYKPSWKGSRALDTWRNVPDKLWAVTVLVPKAAGLEIYWVNRIQQLEWQALQLGRVLPLQPWGLDWLLQHMRGDTWWWLELHLVTRDHTLWRGLSLLPNYCCMSLFLLLFSYDKNNSTICTGCLNSSLCHLWKSKASSFIPSCCLWKPHLTFWSPSFPTSSCLDGENMKVEWWFGPLLPELFVGSSRSGGAPSGQGTGRDIYQRHHRLPRLTCGSAHSVMSLSCLFNPRHMWVTRANPVARQKPCCVFVEQLLGSWCTAVARLLWKWRVTWSFNLFFFSFVFFSSHCLSPDWYCR